MRSERSDPQRPAESVGGERVTAGAVPQGSLRSNFSWTLAGNIIYSACQWGMLMALVKLGSAQMVGQFALAVAVTTPVFAFANLQLRNIQATDASGMYRFADYLGLRSVTTSLALLTTALIAALGGFGWELGLVIMIAGAGRGFDALSDVIHGWLQQREDMAPIAISMIVNGALSLIGLGLGILLTGNLIYGMLGSATASAVTLVGYTLPVFRRRLPAAASVRPALDRSVLARLTWLALPMGIVMLFSALDGSIPRLVIEYQLGQEELGIFAALAYLILAGTTVVLALGQSASPRLAQYFAQGDFNAFRRLLFVLGGAGLLMGLIGAVITVAIGQPIIRVLYSEEYAHHIDTLTILAIAAGLQFAASFAGFGMTAAWRFRVQVPVYATVVIVNLVASVLLVPRFGLNGAALSTGIAALVSLTAGTWAIARAIREAKGRSSPAGTDAVVRPAK